MRHCFYLFYGLTLAAFVSLQAACGSSTDDAVVAQGGGQSIAGVTLTIAPKHSIKAPGAAPYVGTIVMDVTLTNGSGQPIWYMGTGRMPYRDVVNANHLRLRWTIGAWPLSGTLPPTVLEMPDILELSPQSSVTFSIELANPVTPSNHYNAFQPDVPVVPDPIPDDWDPPQLDKEPDPILLTAPFVVEAIVAYNTQGMTPNAQSSPYLQFFDWERTGYQVTKSIVLK
jgi:hypothetical protein